MATRKVTREHPVNIYTIAGVAGVHAATVSRALRGVRGVSVSERDRIREIAQRLGYRPNPFVAAYTAQVRTYRRAPEPATIALLDCWPEERPPWASFDDDIDYMSGIRRRAESLGYRVERITLSDLAGSLDRLQRLLVTRGIYGLLVLPVPKATALSSLDYSRLACATIDFSLQQPPTMRRASPNYYYNMWLALTTLADRGYRRIGYIATRATSRSEEDLHLAAFLAFRLTHLRTCIAPCLTDTTTRHRDLGDWLRRERPDVVLSLDFTFPDDLAAAGKRVPDEIGCVGLGGRPKASSNLTYINENYREVGAQAVDMIVDAIHRNEFGLPATRAVHLVDGFWQEGGTVRPPPSGAAGQRAQRPWIHSGDVGAPPVARRACCNVLAH